MKISVIVATYNCERYISRSIRSLIDQSLPKKDFEIIVVDDGSTDRTRVILETFGDWIRTIEMPKHSGLPAACNEGIRKALGRYVVRVDADDYIHEDMLRVEYLYMSLNPHFDAVACDYYLVDETEKVVERRDPVTHPIACGILFKKDCLVDIGLYDESFLALEDEELRIRFLKKYNIQRIELPLYRYRMHGANLSKNKARIDHYQNLLNKKHGEQKQD